MKKSYSEKRRRRKQVGDEVCGWSREKHINSNMCEGTRISKK